MKLWGLIICLSIGLGACAASVPSGAGDAEPAKATPATPTAQAKRQTAGGTSVAPVGPYLARYTRVIVADFDEVVSGPDPERPWNAAEIAVRFSDLIAAKLRHFEAFSEVVREGTPDSQTLLVGGTITRLEEGSAFARLLIGTGLGSSHFDADIELRDGTTGELVHRGHIGDSSWILGGLLAAGQTLDSFVKRGATEVAEIVHQGKLGRTASYQWQKDHPPQGSADRPKSRRSSRTRDFTATRDPNDRLPCSREGSGTEPTSNDRSNPNDDVAPFDPDIYNRVVVLSFETPGELRRFGSKFPHSLARHLKFDDEFEEIRWLATPTAGQLVIGGSIACFEHTDSGSPNPSNNGVAAATLELNVEFRDGEAGVPVGSRVYRKEVRPDAVRANQPRFVAGEIQGASYILAEMFERLGREISATKRGHVTTAERQMSDRHDGFRR